MSLQLSKQKGMKEHITVVKNKAVHHMYVVFPAFLIGMLEVGPLHTVHTKLTPKESMNYLFYP